MSELPRKREKGNLASKQRNDNRAGLRTLPVMRQGHSMGAGDRRCPICATADRASIDNDGNAKGDRMTPVAELSGRELDAAVAMEIYGWRLLDTHPLDYGFPPNGSPDRRDIPLYHADANLAIAVAENIFIAWKIARDPNEYYATVYNGIYATEAVGVDPREAILRACVAEVRAQRDGENV